MVTVSGTKVHDFAFVNVERHLQLLVPLDVLVKVLLDDFADFEREDFNPASKSLMYMIKRMSPSTDPWGTPLVTGSLTVE